jgi:predicted nucleic acid-binding Zn ribbon protein
MPVYTFRCSNCDELVEKEMSMKVYASVANKAGVSTRCPSCSKISKLKRVITLAIPVVYMDDGFTLRKKSDV